MDHPIIIELTPAQWEIVCRSLQHTATAILAARDTHLMTQAEAEAKHTETWRAYCDIQDQLDALK